MSAEFGKRELTIGALVVSRGFRDLGVAKIADMGQGRVMIEWFDSIANPIAHSAEVEPEDLTFWRPIDQTRVWFRQDQWRVGRIMEHEFDRVRVRQPGGVDVWIGREQIFVRWNRPLEDPVPVMQACGMESPYHFTVRSRFVAAMLEQHAACRGISALPSAAIKIVDHQVDAVARVLSDPVQRYLLADEVGLGKTIEAGLLIRQRLLNNPEAVIRIVVPSQIEDQWATELEEKFFIDDFPLAIVEINASEDPEAWRLDRDAPPDLLVIDEAHHVAAWESGPSALRRRYKNASTLAHQASSLLVLSATPVAHHERTFLAMLHLLDPENYRLRGLDDFRRRVNARHELSRAMVLFRPGQQLRRMRRNADNLRGLLGSDELALRLLDEIVKSDDDEIQDVINRRITALRSALAERHRIYHRMIRHRRDEVADF